MQIKGESAVALVSANGEVRVDGGKAHVITVAPTVTAGAYDADDILGGKMTVADAARVSGGTGMLTGITLIAEDDGSADWLAEDVEVLLFESDPADTYTDNATLVSSLTDADGAASLPSVLLDVKSNLGNITQLKVVNVNMPFKCSGSANLYAIAINRGGRTPDATDALTFKFHMIRD